jgi:Cu-Zn family superoxide dismutase
MKEMAVKKFILSFAVFIFLSACSHVVWAASAKIVIAPTKEGSAVSGSASLEDTPNGLHISAEFKGLPPGKHGFHIHEKGNCADEGKAAGGHFNPASAPHGLLTKDGLHAAHAGDLGNIQVDAEGSAKTDLTLPGLTLKGGEYPVGGLAVIVHEKEDYFGQPTGNAGGRIGCGIIEVSE